MDQSQRPTDLPLTFVKPKSNRVSFVNFPNSAGIRPAGGKNKWRQRESENNAKAHSNHGRGLLIVRYVNGPITTPPNLPLTFVLIMPKKVNAASLPIVGGSTPVLLKCARGDRERGVQKKIGQEGRVVLILIGIFLYIILRRFVDRRINDAARRSISHHFSYLRCRCFYRFL